MRLQVYVCIFCCWTIFSGAGVPASGAVEWLQGTEHDFGDIPRHRPVRWEFTFKNIGQEPVVIETVRTSCGCTAADWPEEPIAPGETSKIAIEYDAYNPGNFSKKIKVFFFQQRKAETLRITGNVE